MILIFHPEDLSKGCNKKNPAIEDFFISKSSEIVLAPHDVVLYRYDEETIILKGPEQSE